MEFKNWIYYDRQINFLKKRSTEFSGTCDFVLLGDSITEGFNVTRYSASSKKIINSGISGDLLVNMPDRFERDVLAYNPKYCHLLAGINDFRFYFKKTFDSQVIDTKEVEELCQTMISKILEISQKCQANNIKLIVGQLFLNHETEFVNYEVINYTVRKFNQMIAQNAIGNYQVINYEKQMLTVDGLLSFDYCPDGLHPNEYGYYELVKCFKQNFND